MSVVPNIALSGCGAVASEYYGPVLQARAAAGALRVAAIHDPSAMRRAAVAGHFPDAAQFDDFGAMLALKPDLVIVASPPAHHADQSIAALEAGAAVLCEKPMALSLARAEAMAVAASRTGGLLAVAMVRRHFPASRIVRRVIRESLFGSPLGIEIFEGGPFAWPIGDQSYFSRAVSGGGVLTDVGSHLLDLLGFWLGDLELVSAADDAMGGVEANALLDLRAGDAPISMRLSRDWARPNAITIRLPRADMRWCAETPGHVDIVTKDGEALQIAGDPAGPQTFIDCFAAQIDAMLDRMAGGSGAIVTGAEALATVALIERAYASRTPMAMPWLEGVRDGR